MTQVAVWWMGAWVLFLTCHRRYIDNYTTSFFPVFIHIICTKLRAPKYSFLLLASRCNSCKRLLNSFTLKTNSMAGKFAFEHPSEVFPPYFIIKVIVYEGYTTLSRVKIDGLLFLTGLRASHQSLFTNEKNELPVKNILAPNLVWRWYSFIYHAPVDL